MVCSACVETPFRCFKTSLKVIRLVGMTYVRLPLPLQQVENLLHERSIDVGSQTVRLWQKWLGPLIAAEIRKRHIKA